MKRIFKRFDAIYIGMIEPVLIVEDDPMQRQMLISLLQRKLGYESQMAENGREALAVLEGDKARAIRLVIMDLNMPVMGGMETLEMIRQRYPHLPVVMLTGSKDIRDAVAAMKLGATDFLTKPYEGDRMMVTVQNALKLSTLSKELQRLKGEKDGTLGFEDLIGVDGGLMETVAIARKAAAADIPVLLTGETGSGKEVFARAIHGESARQGKPFIAVNCGAIPAQLVESTLFGHEKGAFTGATEKAPGKFREADGGTVFLDEIGELPLDSQVKLLRVLQQKEVEPVGAAKPVPVNVRIISATNRDLGEAVKEGKFREDLYFRLNVLHIELPPLRGRRADIPLLVRHFIERACAQAGMPPRDISRAALAALEKREWPGNIRQLENAVSRALVLSDRAILEMGDFEQATGATAPAGQEDVSAQGQSINLFRAGGAFRTMEEIESEVMQAALDHFGQNVTQAAKALGMAKSTFYRKTKS